MKFFDKLRGSREFSVSVPPLDGPLKPNDELDAATELAEMDAADNIVEFGDRLLFSSGARLFEVASDTEGVNPKEIEAFDSDISCLASNGTHLVLALESGALIYRTPDGQEKQFETLGSRRISCVTAIAFDGVNDLIICLGSQDHAAVNWSHDLLLRGSTGSLWRLDTASGNAQLLQDRMAFPNGVVVDPQGDFIVSESWKHRLLRVSEKPSSVLMDDLPFYPGRLSTAPSGQILICGFAPRRQMVEFMLHEHKFVERMMSEIAEKHWMAPTLSSGKDFLEPLQGGQIRHHGVMKPWSPTKSYGLLVQVSQSGQLLRSMHSRAGMDRHGITSAIEVNGRILMTSKGGGYVLSAPFQEA